MNNSISKSEYEKAVKLVEYCKEFSESISVTMIQRRFRIGSRKAMMIMNKLENDGYVGKFESSNPRKILI